MAGTDSGWMLVDQANKLKEKNEGFSTDGDTDQEFEVVKEGISPPKYLPLLQLAEDHYANDYTDDGSDIEVLKTNDKDSPVFVEPIENISWIDEDENDWFTIGYQGNFNCKEETSDTESYGLAELFHNDNYYHERRDSCGLVCDWQPRSRTSPVVILILLGVSVGIVVIGNRGPPLAIENGKSGTTTTSNFDVIVLSSRLNSSLARYKKLQTRYREIEQVNSEVVKRLQLMTRVLDIWRNQSDGKTDKINNLQEMIWFQKDELHKCQKKLDQLQTNISMSDESDGKTFETPSFKQCLTMISDSFPNLNLSRISLNNSKTHKILNKVAKHVSDAKTKLEGKLSLFNKSVITTWKHVTDKWQHYKRTRSNKQAKKSSKKSKRNKQNKKRDMRRMQKLFSMSNIVSSPRHETTGTDCPESLQSGKYCHLRTDIAKNFADFKKRWQEKPDDLGLLYPKPMNPSDFVSSKPERSHLVDWSQHGNIDFDQHNRDDSVLNGKQTLDGIEQREIELNRKQIILDGDRNEFEDFRLSEIRRIKKLNKKLQQWERSIIEKEKSYIEKLVNAYDSKIARANRKLKKKKNKFDKKLKNLKKLLTVVLRKRLDDLRAEKEKASKFTKRFAKQKKKYDIFMTEKENELKKQSKIVSQYKTKHHDLETKLNELKQLHNSLRLEYANLKLKHSQSYGDLVFDRKLQRSKPIDDIPDVEIEEWVASVSCADQEGCQRLSHSDPSRLTYLKPTVSYTGKARHTQPVATPKGITPSPPTKHFDFSLLGSSTAFICNESSTVLKKSGHEKKEPSPHSSVKSHGTESLWYFDMMKERETQRSVPLSWYLYWAKGREESRHKGEELKQKSHVKDWYFSMMNEREHIRGTPSTAPD